MSEPTFGRSILQSSATEILELEAAGGRSERFTDLDRLLTDIATGAFAGYAPVELHRSKRATALDTVTIAGLSTTQRSMVDEWFRLANQEARGAWFLPEEVSLKYGVCNLPAARPSHLRFAMNAARDAVIKVDLRASPDALAAWALLIPLFSDLVAPIEVRAATGKLPTPDQQRQTWANIDDTYADLGIDVNEQLEAMRYGGGWSRMRIGDQVAARQGLLVALAGQIGPATTSRWRARSVGKLTEAYYRKAKKESPLARTVLSRALQPAFSGLFAGDWLAFLGYLDEQPNDGEKITTALPEARLYVGGSSKAAAVAAEQGLPVDEVERMLGALLGHSSGTSPIEERVAVMRNWWAEFDRAHAAQRSGMRSLWGLVDEGLDVIPTGNGSTPALYRQLLPPELCADVDRLWDGATLARWPDRIVSEFRPHRQMAETFGPAVDLWHGIGLTCWFVCEGPRSRTDLAGVAGYHRRFLAELDDAGFPVDPQLFVELKDAERRLGPIEELQRSTSTEVSGITLTTSFSLGQRRDGFDVLRDIVTSHRQAWAEQHLDAYLRHRWDSELREVAREFNRRSAARSKPPTFKQFAGFGADAANHWFGGDLVAVHAALGEASPATTARYDLLPGDPFDFARRVYLGLGGSPSEPEERDYDEVSKQWQLGRLAGESLRYLQLHEALGRPPTAKEFNADRFDWEPLGGEDAGWARFERIIEAARTGPPLHADERAVRPPTAPAPVAGLPTREHEPRTSIPPDPGHPAETSSEPAEAPRNKSFMSRLRGR